VDFNDYNLTQLVRLMDVDSSGRVSCEEFRRAITTYANGLKPLTIQEVDFKVNSCMQKLENIGDAVAEVLSRLDSLGSLKGVDKSRTLEAREERSLSANSAAGPADTSMISGNLLAIPLAGDRSYNKVPMQDAGLDKPFADFTKAIHSSAASTTASYVEIGSSEVLIADAFPRLIGLETQGGSLGGDSEWIQKGLRDLCRCVRECAQRQLAGQRDLEVALRDGIACLRSQVREDLHAASSSSSLYEPADLSRGGDGAVGRGGQISAVGGAGRPLQQHAGCTSAANLPSDSMQTSKLGGGKAGEAADPRLREGWLSNL